MMDLSIIQRPTLLLDERICRANIAYMCGRAAASGVRFRPHMKTAQSRRVAGWFREAGVDSITVSSVGMAHYFADDGWNDITIAFPFNPREIAAVNAIPAHVRLNLLIESTDVADFLAVQLTREAGVWIKLDTGYGRTGVRHDDDTTIDALIRSIGRIPRLQLHGFLTHAGMTYAANGADEVRRLFEQSRARLVDAARRHGDGLLCSAGDTPGCTLADSFAGLHEIRPGNMTYYDVMQTRLDVCTTGNIAVAVACPVVALHPERGEAVLYGGAVHLSRDSVRGDDGLPVYGLLCSLNQDGWSAPIEGARMRSLSQEHGIARIPEAALRMLKPGDLVAVLPVHSCLTAEALGGGITLDAIPVDHYAAHRMSTSPFSGMHT